jgi:hypothetical protein
VVKRGRNTKGNKVAIINEETETKRVSRVLGQGREIPNLDHCHSA